MKFIFQFRFVAIVFTLLLAEACTTPAKSPESQPDVVLSRIDGLEKRPEWLKESEPFKIANGNVIALGSTTIPADNRVEAGYRIAENNGKGAIASAIESRLEFVFQNAEEGTGMDNTQARYIGAEASKLVTSSLRQDKRYYEKVAMTQDDGSRVTKYRIFTTVVMPEADFKRAVLEAIKRSQGSGLSESFAKKVDQQWDKFVNGEQKDESEKSK